MRRALLAILLVGGGARALLAVAHGAMEGDEYVYLRMAQDLVGDLPGDHPLLEPVLFPLLLAGVHFLTGEWENTARTLSVLCGSGLLLAVASVGRAALSPLGGALGALLLALYPPLVDLSARPMTEPLYHLLLVGTAWPGWRALCHYQRPAEEAPGHLPAVLWGLALGLAALARREGKYYLLVFPALLLVVTWRRRGPREALLAAGACAAGAALVVGPSQFLVERVRGLPTGAYTVKRLFEVGRGLLLPLLAPALLFSLCPRRPGDGLRALLFGAFLSAAPVIALFPDSGRKATALAPFATLLAGEAVARWARRSPGPALALLAGTAGWFLVQGVSAPMMPHFVPPWIDPVENRAAGEWLRARLEPMEPLVCYDLSVAYYAVARPVRVDPAPPLEAFLRRCREKGARYLVVDRRSVCRSHPLLEELGREPRDRPGLRLVEVFPLELSPLNRFLSSHLRSKRVRPDEGAVVYRLLEPPKSERSRWRAQ